MEADHALDTISLATFQSLLAQHESLIPTDAVDVNTGRYRNVPESLARMNDLDKPYLLHFLLPVLASHGLASQSHRVRFRDDNPRGGVKDIKNVTSEAYHVLNTATEDEIEAAIEKLRGFGLSTATLLISLYRPADLPYFSEELRRWCLTPGELTSPETRGSVAEYLKVVRRVLGLRRRFGEEVKAVDVERVAYVLSRRNLLPIVPPKGGGRVIYDEGSEDELA